MKWWLLVAALALVVQGGRAQTGPSTSTPAAQGIDYPIVVCRMPVAGNSFRNAFPDAANFSLYIGQGTDLCIVHPDGAEELLFEAGPLGACADPVVSYDGKTVFFTYFVDPQDINTQRGVSKKPAHIWKIDVATKVATQLTFGVDTSFMDTAHQVDPQYSVFDVAPLPLPDGRLLFLSSREACMTSTGTSVAQFPAMKFWRMNADGSNMEPMERFTQGACQHPFILKDGRVVWTHYHPAGRRSTLGGNHALFVARQDLSDIKTFAGAHHQGTSWHFAAQLSGGDIVSTAYYHQNNFGHGTLVRWPVDPGHASGQEFTPVSTSLGTYNIYGQNDHYDREGEYLATPWSLQPTTPSLSYDSASVLLADGTRAGKCTMPTGAPDGHMLLIWSSGNVNNLNRPVPELPHMKLCFAPNGHLAQRDDIVILKESASHHYLYPRALVPYSRIYGIAKPPAWPDTPNDGALPVLPAGAPFATTGTSSVYNRESHWPASYHDHWDENIVNNYATNTARFWVGQDARPFNDGEIHAAQVVVDMTRQDTRYQILSNTFRSHNRGRQIWAVLGEIPVRKTDALGNPVLDAQGNPDTSYEVRIPANVPFHHRLIDQNGLLLTGEWTWHAARPGERKTNCGGCHAHSTDTTALDFGTTAAAQPGYVIQDFALQTPMVDRNAAGDLVTILEPVRAKVVEYHQDVKPILQAKCVSCHGDVNPAGGLDLQGDDAVDALAFDDATLFGHHQATRWVRRHASSQSLLVWKAFGQRLDGRQNGDRTNDVDFTGDVMPPPGSGVPPLTFQEKRTLALWIDLGCLTDTNPAVAQVGDPQDDQMKPTLVIGGPTGKDVLGSPPGLTVGAYDVHAGIDPTSLVVTVTEAGGTMSGNLAGGAAPSDGDVTAVTLPTLATNATHTIDVAVADQAGNISRRRIEVTPRDVLHGRDDLLLGQPAALTVTGAAPGEEVWFLGSLNGIGPGACFPALGGLCLDLADPVIIIGSASADAQGTAALGIFIPSWLPLLDVATQAVILRGPGGTDAVKSNPIDGSLLP